MEQWGCYSLTGMFFTLTLVVGLTVGEEKCPYGWAAFGVLVFVACELAFPGFVPFNAIPMALIFLPVRGVFAFRNFIRDMLPWMRRQARIERDAKKKEKEKRRYGK